MALRVLLADESSTIKKVMQLALQDFGVEVKAVPIGLDVLQVARNFNPDIVFADVLLAKKNGYEVSAELKSDPTLKKIPVVLMWSGFMELDEAKASASRAERRLEKPFDAETLRSLIKELVPSLGSNLISNFLSFPEMPEMVEDGKKAPQEEPVEIQVADLRKSQIPIASTAPISPISANAMDIPSVGPLVSPPKKTTKPIAIPSVEDFPALDEIEEPEEFQAVPLPKNQGLPVPKNPSAPPEDWARQDLSRYKIDLPKDDVYSIDEADLTNTSIVLSSGIEEIALEDIDNPEPRPRSQQSQTARQAPASKTFSTSSSSLASPMTSSMNRQSNFTGSSPSLSQSPSLMGLDPMRAEELLRQEARNVLETVAWKLLPEIVERVVREELQKLLKDAERL